MSTSSSTQVQLGGVSSAGTNTLLSSTLTLPAASVATTASISLTASAPSGVAAPASRQASVRIASLGVQSTIAYLALQFPQSVTMAQSIGFVAHLPGTPSGNWYLLFDDPTGALGTGWSEIAQFSVSGDTLTISPSSLGSPITLRANQVYYFAIASTGNTPIGGSTPSPSPSASSSPTASPSTSPSASPEATIDPAAIPLGGAYSSTTPAVGSIYSCSSSFGGNGGGGGPWIDTANNTWNSETKPHVEGSVSWPSAAYTFATSGTQFALTTNDLPVNETTGTFPIALSDPAHQYDGNPNSILTQSISVLVALNPTVAAKPSCLHLGAIGIMNTGVVVFDGQDAEGRDAAAYEVLDACEGHPQSQGIYHYHAIDLACITDTHDTDGHSGLLGYAFDGFGIYGPDGVGGNALTNADLDECHGHTHAVTFHGTTQTIYHYHVTTEYPFTLGCYRGTPAAGY